jgi:hypothetical protein
MRKTVAQIYGISAPRVDVERDTSVACSGVGPGIRDEWVDVLVISGSRSAFGSETNFTWKRIWFERVLGQAPKAVQACAQGCATIRPNSLGK